MHTHRTSHGSFASSRLPRARPRAPPARSSPGSARRRDPDARIHPCPLASLPRHGSLARAFHRRDALARVRSDASREQSPVHLSRARRFPRVIVTLVRTRWMRTIRARAVERDRTRTRDVPRAMREKSARALIRAIVVVDAMLAVVRACADGREWARDDVAMKTTVSLFTHTNVCG